MEFTHRIYCSLLLGQLAYYSWARLTLIFMMYFMHYTLVGISLCFTEKINQTALFIPIAAFVTAGLYRWLLISLV